MEASTHRGSTRTTGKPIVRVIAQWGGPPAPW